MPSCRTIRKPTLWTPEEWRRIEDAAQLRRVPPLRHVREAALAAQLPPAADRRGAHALMEQFHRVLNNLNQLLRLADADGAHIAAAALERTIRITELAAEAAAARRGSAHVLIIRVREAGMFLNELARKAHGSDDLPSDEDLRHALSSIESAASDVMR